MKNSRLIVLFIALLVILCSCNEKKSESSPQFPATPDKIVVGGNGDQFELYPGDENFDIIISAIESRVENSGIFGTLRLDALDPEAGEHLSNGLRKEETYVEFLYNQAGSHKFNMAQSGGGVAAEEIEVQRVFFPLSGIYHKCIFIGKDSEYQSHITLGQLTDDTSLVTYVRNIVTQMSSAD